MLFQKSLFKKCLKILTTHIIVVKTHQIPHWPKMHLLLRVTWGLPRVAGALCALPPFTTAHSCPTRHDFGLPPPHAPHGGHGPCRHRVNPSATAHLAQQPSQKPASMQTPLTEHAGRGNCRAHTVLHKRYQRRHMHGAKKVLTYSLKENGHRPWLITSPISECHPVSWGFMSADLTDQR